MQRIFPIWCTRAGGMTLFSNIPKWGFGRVTIPEGVAVTCKVLPAGTEPPPVSETVTIEDWPTEGMLVAFATTAKKKKRLRICSGKARKLADQNNAKFSFMKN